MSFLIRHATHLLLSSACVASGQLILPNAAVAQNVTFHRDVEPLLQRHCQECHRPGEIGPMPLRTYSEVRPWAQAIKRAVASRVMPPWFADSNVRHYQNEALLSDADIQKVVDWVDGGAVEGKSTDAPVPKSFVDGWSIGQPDVTVELPTPINVPASGTIDYTYVIIPTHFTEDHWVTAAEIRPGNRSVVHHAAIHVRPPTSSWLRSFAPGVAFIPDRAAGMGVHLSDEYLAKYAPGRPSGPLSPGTAFLVRAGSDFVVQLHYTTNGTATTDRTKIGLVFAKTPPQKRAFIAPVMNPRLVIPAGASDYQEKAIMTLTEDATLLSVGPHMHARGVSMDVTATTPDGAPDVLVRVPKYDFNWQLLYEFDHPIAVPKGTRLQAFGRWDNSASNRHNPDPTATVHWGDQSWDEMIIAWVLMQIDPKADVDKMFSDSPFARQ